MPAAASDVSVLSRLRIKKLDHTSFIAATYDHELFPQYPYKGNSISGAWRSGTDGRAFDAHQGERMNLTSTNLPA